MSKIKSTNKKTVSHPLRQNPSSYIFNSKLLALLSSFMISGLHVVHAQQIYPANTHYIQPPLQPVGSVSGVNISAPINAPLNTLNTPYSPAPASYVNANPTPEPPTPDTPKPAATISTEQIPSTPQSANLPPQPSVLPLFSRHLKEHVVSSGETLYTLSKRYGVPQKKIMAINDLVTDNIIVGQTLIIDNVVTYQVQKGDYAIKIAENYEVELQDILKFNGLHRHSIIEIGQVIRVPLPIVDKGPDYHHPQPMLANTQASQTEAPALTGTTQVTPITQSGQTIVVAQPTPTAPATPATVTATPPPQATAQTTPPAAGQSFGNLVVKSAMTYLNIPYRYGAQSRRRTDCSGLTLQIFANLGVKLPRRSIDQSNVGKQVSRRNLQVGDLVFFDTLGKNRVSHVGIYIGNGQFINANSYKSKVAIDDMNSKYWKDKFMGARRVIPEYMAAN